MAESRPALTALDWLRIEDRDRRRIARRLHDGPQQVVVSLGLRLQLLEQRVDEEVLPEVHALARQVEAARDELRGMILDLDPPSAEDGLASSLRALLETYAAAPGWRTDLDVGPGVDDIDEDVRRTVERVVQEALANARRHAQATAVSITAAEQEGVLRVVVADDGIGVPPDVATESREHGVRAAQERMQALGGSLQIERDGRDGTRVTLAVAVDAGRPGPGAAQAPD